MTSSITRDAAIKAVNSSLPLNALFGAKWRNWKILIKEMGKDGYGIKNMAYLSVYNLIVDPKQEIPELNYLNDTWVDFPLYQVIEDHIASIEQDPGAPDP
jgi:arylsulfatase